MSETWDAFGAVPVGEMWTAGLPAEQAGACGKGKESHDQGFAPEYLKYIPKPCTYRPFVCKGFPESCAVIVIGNNPATQMGSDWWEFWNPRKGFDLDKFENKYKEQRRKAGKKTVVSPTRRALNYLRQNGLACLETNAFVNERPDGHGDGTANDCLEYFVRHLPNLKGVIAHGRIAQRCVKRLSLPDHVEQYDLRHLSRESYVNLDRAIKHFVSSHRD